MTRRPQVTTYYIRQLEPDNYTDLVLDETQSSYDVELWDGEKVSKTIFLSLDIPTFDNIEWE